MILRKRKRRAHSTTIEILGYKISNQSVPYY